METYFNIRYEFDRDSVREAIDRRLREPGADYVCVADGVILTAATRDDEYRRVVNGGMFSICDSSYVPLYIDWIYGRSVRQYCGSEIFRDIVSSRKYRMIFLGTQQPVLDGLRENLRKLNPDVGSMRFVELPFCEVGEFDYAGIAEMIEADGADIVWVALGAPKQEVFMSMLKPRLGWGVIIAVGAAFKFFSGVETKRAPGWMVRHHLEFIHRLCQEPGKQFRRCYGILRTRPAILYREWRVSRSAGSVVS